MCMVEVARYLGEFVLCVQWGWVRMAECVGEFVLRWEWRIRDFRFG